MPNSGFPFKVCAMTKNFGEKAQLHSNGISGTFNSTPSLVGAFTNANYQISGGDLGKLNGEIAEVILFDDGFEISEVDLRLRGPGDLDGTQQSGVLDFKIADLVHDGQILQLARSTAQAILNEDEQLALPENQLLVRQLAAQAQSKSSWSKIG
jgi:hypothetical protein